MKNKYNNITLFAIITVMLMTLSGCQNSKAPIVNNQGATSKIVNVEFGDVFLSFTELKNVSSNLLSKDVDNNWWMTFDSVSSKPKALIDQNNFVKNTNELPESDKQLSNSLTTILNLYNEAFNIMQASKTSNDQEILRYAYNEFSIKITSANEMWDESLKNVLENQEQNNLNQQ